MTVLRLRAVSAANCDRAIATPETTVLVRRAEGAFIEVPVFDVRDVVRALALCGVSAEPSDVDLGVPRTLIPAIGRDLAPLSADVAACDVVHVRRLALGEATREILRRRVGGLVAPSEEARARARGLLRGEETLLAWSRRAWASRGALRTPAARRSLRAVVFDRAALERSDLGGRTFASAGSVGRWLFA